LPSELQQRMEGLALRRPRRSIATIHRQVGSLAQQHGWSQPSYGTVYDVIRHLDPGLVMLAHEGPKAYKETFDLHYRREASRPNEIWQADHTSLDIWVRDERGYPVRPWLTVILDDYSRAVAGYRVGTEAPSALRTALVLRQAIWRKSVPHWQVCGIPDAFYTDHGSDSSTWSKSRRTSRWAWSSPASANPGAAAASSDSSRP
jgi:putative transposase